MKIPKTTRLPRSGKYFAATLAMALAMPLMPLGAQTDSGALRRLQEENAALRKRLAELEGRTAPAAATTAQPAAQQTAPTADRPAPQPRTPILSAPAEDDTVVLSPFEVQSEKDYGYLRTNAATATRIGMEIQKVPINISVLSEDFLKDTGLVTITDIMRYTASGSPDSRFAMRRPANEATPQGNFTMRGFTINSLMRNGVFRYTSYNLDNVERVEVVKGPAAVFFGQGYPGGVINYITKKPSFNKIPSSFSYLVDNDGGEKVTLDHNAVLSKTAAFRVVGAWTDFNGERKGEFRNNTNITPSLTLVPFTSGKLRINLEVEMLRESFNKNDYAWIFPTGWFQAYNNPTPELIAAAGLTTNANPVAAYRSRIFNSWSNWMVDNRKAKNDLTLPLYTNVSPYGYYTDTKGNRVRDTGFNFSNSGARSEKDVTTFQATIDMSPTEWLDARYVFTKDNDRFDNFEGLVVPNADGITFNAANGGNGSGYYRRTDDHQLDIVVKANVAGIKNKFLFGGVQNKYFQQYMASQGAVYWAVPGYNYPTPPVMNVPNPNGSNGMVLTNQVIRDRSGNILTAQQVYSMYDPAIHVTPPVDKVYNVERNLLDGYKPERTALYLNWQANMLKDRLTTLAGYRREDTKDNGQNLTANFPWFVTPPDAYANPTAFPPDVYNYSISYAGDPENFKKRHGDSWMAGVSYALTPSVSLYATVSKTFKINTGIAGGYDKLNIDNLLKAALANGGGKFTYNGKTISSIDEGKTALAAAGADDSIKNEAGMNYEVGVKTSLWDNKLVSTFSLFRGMRKDQKLDDSQRQSTDPFNYSTTMFNATQTDFYNKRNFRWRTVGVKNQVEGTEFDIIYTPVRNFQTVINGAWMWQAETLDNLSVPKPGSTAYNAATATNQAYYALYYSNRIENVPEFRFNAYNRYTFTDGFARGLSIALGARYSSETIISRSIDWNPDRGGFTAGNYLVFDANIAYPWELYGYKLNTALGIYNLLDKTYYEGNFVPADHRTWTLRTTVSF